jgi:hypothetical protein
MGGAVMSRNPFLIAALTAAKRGWFVFPLVPGGKTPAVRDWEHRATTDRRQIFRWWAAGRENNVGVAAGRSGLLVIDLDDGRGQEPPPRFAGALNGRDALAMLAVELGEKLPTDTFEVETPGRGGHLYFRAPSGVELRNSSGSLAWKVDSRGHGGYCVAAGSVREQGEYRVVRSGDVAELPAWLTTALSPALPPALSPARPLEPVVVELPGRHAAAYVRAIVESEAHAVAAARTGTRHRSLLKAARVLGELVAGGELVEEQAWAALLAAAAGHIGVDDCTTAEVEQTIRDGLIYGARRPRRVTGEAGGR